MRPRALVCHIQLTGAGTRRLHRQASFSCPLAARPRRSSSGRRCGRPPPIWSTRTRSASPSQSSATDHDPLDVAGRVALDPVSSRLRDQYVHRPLVSVRCSASSSIQPSISTSPVSCCWAMAATRPSASRFSRAAIPGRARDRGHHSLLASSPSAGPDLMAGRRQRLLDRADGDLAEMEQARRQHGVGPGVVAGPKWLARRPAAGYHRNADRLADGLISGRSNPFLVPSASTEFSRISPAPRPPPDRPPTASMPVPAVRREW